MEEYAKSLEKLDIRDGKSDKALIDKELKVFK